MPHALTMRKVDLGTQRLVVPDCLVLVEGDARTDDASVGTARQLNKSGSTDCAAPGALLASHGRNYLNVTRSSECHGSRYLSVPSWPLFSR